MLERKRRDKKEKKDHDKDDKKHKKKDDKPKKKKSRESDDEYNSSDSERDRSSMELKDSKIERRRDKPDIVISPVEVSPTGYRQRVENVRNVPSEDEDTKRNTDPRASRRNAFKMSELKEEFSLQHLHQSFEKEQHDVEKDKEKEKEKHKDTERELREKFQRRELERAMSASKLRNAFVPGDQKKDEPETSLRVHTPMIRRESGTRIGRTTPFQTEETREVSSDSEKKTITKKTSMRQITNPFNSSVKK